MTVKRRIKDVLYKSVLDRIASFRAFSHQFREFLAHAKVPALSTSSQFVQMTIFHSRSE